MSRIGRLPIAVPSGVTVNIKDSQVTVKGPKGEISQTFVPDMAIKLEDGKLIVDRPSDSKENRALHGLTRSLLNNMVTGVTKGWEKTWKLSGWVSGLRKPVRKLYCVLVFRIQLKFRRCPVLLWLLMVPAGLKLRVSIKKPLEKWLLKCVAFVRRMPIKVKASDMPVKLVRIKPGKAGKAVGKGK